MRKIFAILLIGWLGFGANVVPGRADSAATLLARYHFAGTAQLSADTNAAKLVSLWSLPTAVALREQILQKMARAPQTLLRRYFDTAGKEVAPLIRPLLEDLIQAESYGEVHGQAEGAREWLLAVRLKEAQAQVWQTNLWKILERWQAGTLSPYSAPQGSGWEVQLTAPPGYARFVRAGAWCVFSVGQESMPHLTHLLQQIKKYGNPPVGDGEAWFDGYVDGARLAPGWRLWPHRQNSEAALPSMEITLSSKADYVRSKASVRFVQDQQWPTEPWSIPTNTMHDPMISFTAMKGTAPWFANWEFFKRLQIEPPPNQLFIWALSQVPFQTFGAVPVQQASNLMGRLALRLPPLLTPNPNLQNLGEFHWLTNRSELVWSGLPVITPFLQAVQEPGQDFIVGGFFPASSTTNPVPAELLDQVVGRPNLHYYDWEITQERLMQVWVLFQWYDLLSMNPNPLHTGDNSDARGRPWLLAVASQLGNTVTEAVSVSPRELAITRRSHSGLTGLELVLLTRWLDHPQFPLLGYELPAPGKKTAAKIQSKE